jgi:hypothetical protein
MKKNDIVSFKNEIDAFLNKLGDKNFVNRILTNGVLETEYDNLVKKLNDAFEPNNLQNYLNGKFDELMNNPEISMILIKLLSDNK